MGTFVGLYEIAKFFKITMICLTDKIVINTPNVICRGTDTLTYLQTNKQTNKHTDAYLVQIQG